MSDLENDEPASSSKAQNDEQEPSNDPGNTQEVRANENECSNIDISQNVTSSPNIAVTAHDSPEQPGVSCSTSDEEEIPEDKHTVPFPVITYEDVLPRMVVYGDDIYENKSGRSISPFKPSSLFIRSKINHRLRRRPDYESNPGPFSPIPPMSSSLRSSKSLSDTHSAETSPTKSSDAGVSRGEELTGHTFGSREQDNTNNPLGSRGRWDDEDEDEEFRASIDRGEIQKQITELRRPDSAMRVAQQTGGEDDGFIPLQEARKTPSPIVEDMALRLLEQREVLKELNAHDPTVAAIKGPEPPRLKIDYLEKTLLKVKSAYVMIEERRQQQERDTRAEIERTHQELKKKTMETRVLARKTELWRQHADENQEMAEVGRSMLESMSERELRDLDNGNNIFTSHSPGFEWPIYLRTSLAQLLTTFLHRQPSKIQRTDEETNKLTRQILDAGPLRFQAFVDKLEAMSQPLRPDHLAQELEKFSHENSIEADGEIMFHARQLNDRSESPVPGLLQEISTLEQRRPQAELEQIILQQTLQNTQEALHVTRESETLLRNELQKVQEENRDLEGKFNLATAKLDSIDEEEKKKQKPLSHQSNSPQASSWPQFNGNKQNQVEANHLASLAADSAMTDGEVDVGSPDDLESDSSSDNMAITVDVDPELRQCRKEKSDLEAKVRECEDEIESLSDDLLEACKDITYRAEKVTEARDERDAAKSEIKILKAELMAASEAAKVEAKKVITARNQRDTARKHADQARENARAKVEAAEAAAASAENLAQRASDAERQAKLMANQAKRDLCDIQVSLERHRSSAISTIKERDTLKAELGKIKAQKLKEMAKEFRENEELEEAVQEQKRLRQENARVKARSQEYFKSAEKRALEIERLQTRQEEMERDAKEAADREADMKDEIDRLVRGLRTTSPAIRNSPERARPVLGWQSESPAAGFPSDQLPIGELRPSDMSHHATLAAREAEEQTDATRRRERESRIRNSNAYQTNVQERRQNRSAGMADRNIQWEHLESAYMNAFGWPYLPKISEEGRRLAFLDLAKS